MIPYGRHVIDQQDIDFVVKILRSDWLTCGTAVEAFEKEFAKTVHVNQAIACSNGTTALHLAMLALGVGAGDVVMVPAITFLASANAARYVGADVSFVDVDPETGLMTAGTLEAAILANKGKNLKAVVNVHLAGQCEDLEAIYKVAKSYNLLVIEDAAHAIGTIYLAKDKTLHPIGSNAFSDLTTFSFHPVKTIAMGEGGAVTTNNEVIAEKLRTYRSHGMIRDSLQWKEKELVGPWYYEMHNLGYNYRVSDINCALGLSQLTKLKQFKKERLKLVRNYDKAFENSKHIFTLKKLKTSDTAWHLYVIFMQFEKIKMPRAKLMEALKKEGIGTQVHYIPLYKHPYYKKLYGDIKLKGCEAYYNCCLSLPLYADLSEEKQNIILKAINSL